MFLANHVLERGRAMAVIEACARLLAQLTLSEDPFSVRNPATQGAQMLR